MYDEARAAVRSGAGCMAGFEIQVGFHQGSYLSPLLYIIVMDAISEATRREVPWDMLYAEDLITAEDSASNLQTRFSGWQRALESEGLYYTAPTLHGLLMFNSLPGSSCKVQQCCKRISETLIGYDKLYAMIIAITKRH